MRVALIHNIVPPYRVPLFAALNEQLGGGVAILAARLTHPSRRQWTVDIEPIAERLHFLRTQSFVVKGTSIDVSVGVSRALDAARPNVVVLGGWDLPACWSALRWARRSGIPAVAWVESSLETGRLRGGATQKFRSRFLRACDGALVPGERAAAFVQSLRPQLPVAIVPNPVGDASLFTLPSPAASGGLLYIGEYAYHKGIDLLLDAVPSLLEHFPCVAFAGSGPLSDAVACTARRFDRVKTYGYVGGSQKSVAFNDSAVVCVPSRRDNWPLSACEAIVARRPVVLGPGVGSAPDLLKVGGKGVRQMAAASSEDLVEAALAVRRERIPEEAAAALHPDRVATTMAEALRQIVRAS